jgi:hypothetical protein
VEHVGPAGLLSDLTDEEENRFDESVKRRSFIEGGFNHE